MPPTRLQLICHPSMCINEWHPTASTLCLLGLPRKNMHEVSRSYAQKEAQNDRISNIRVVVLNATLLVFKR